MKPPTWVFVAPPRKSNPFTISDFLTKEQHTKFLATRSPLTYRTKKGENIVINDEYVAKINELEDSFNRLGYSLRDLPPMTVISATAMQTINTRGANVSPPSGPLAQFAGYTWDRSIGADLANVDLHAQLNGGNDPNAASTSVSASAVAHVAGTSFNLLNFSASSNVPISEASVDPSRLASVTCATVIGDCGSSSSTGTNPGPLSASVSYEPAEIPTVQFPFTTMCGPVVCNITIGLKTHLGVTLGADSNQTNGSARLGPSISEYLFVQGGVGGGYGGYGIFIDVGAESLLLRFTPTMSSAIALADQPTETNVNWNYGWSYRIEAFSIDFYILVEADLPIIGDRSWKHVFYSTAPAASAETDTISVSQSVTRPKSCEGNKTMCPTGCVDLGSDVNNCNGCGVTCPYKRATCYRGTCGCEPSCEGVPVGGPDGCGDRCKLGHCSSDSDCKCSCKLAHCHGECQNGWCDCSHH